MKFIVLISGRGSNLSAIINAINSNLLTAELVGVISDNPQAQGLQHCVANGIPVSVVEKKSYMDRPRFERVLQKAVDNYNPELIVLAGFMQVLSAEFVKNNLNKIINIHPSLLPKFKGLNTHQRALQANEKYHGASVHFVTSEIDGGPVIAYSKVLIDAADNAESLAVKVLAKEHMIYPMVIQWFANGTVNCKGQDIFLNNLLLTNGGLEI